MRYLQILFFSFLFTSCYTEKKATKEINKAIDKKPVLSAEIFRNKFPCESVDTFVRVDTAWDYVEFECPDKPAQIKTDTILLTKNVPVKQFIKGKNVVVAGKTEVKTITIKVKDSAEIFLINKRCKDNENELKRKITNQLIFIWILIIALIFSTLYNIIKSQK